MLCEGYKDKNNNLLFVKSLLELYDKYLGVIKSDFAGYTLV